MQYMVVSDCSFYGFATSHLVSFRRAERRMARILLSRFARWPDHYHGRLQIWYFNILFLRVDTNSYQDYLPLELR